MVSSGRKPLNESLAAQIAHLLNLHNHLQSEYTARKVLDARTKYLPEHYEGLVFGSIGVQRMNFMLSEVKHLVVHPAFRRMGLGRKLLKRAMLEADTPLLFATIREGNEASLGLFTSTGFRVHAAPSTGEHRVNFLLRANESYTPPKPADKKQGYPGRALGLSLLGT